MTASTRVETKLDTLTEEESATVAAYLHHGGRENFRNLMNYSRRHLDGKILFGETPAPPKELPRYSFFHTDPEKGFQTYREFIDYYRKTGIYRPENPTVCIFAGNNAAILSDLIGALEKRGFNAVAVAGMGSVETLEEITPDLVIYLPHGRFAGQDAARATAWLKERNVPLLCPIKVSEHYDRFLTDQRGMTDGMLSQSVIMPEFDGGAVPYVISALYRNQRDLLEFRTIPDRLERFADLAAKTIRLRKLSNADKKIAIVFYKGPGQSAMAAAELEVGDSILNTLRTLQKAGYTTGALPETPEELNKQIQENAAIFGAYAEGAFEKFAKTAKLELISYEQYSRWARKGFPAELLTAVEKEFGVGFGKHFTVVKDDRVYLGLSMLRFGNVVLIPQGLPGFGEDTNRIIHGVKKVPPHSYIATYLWIRYGFEADAMMHFGTHGSLEFTPWKQVALSSYDWPDALAGEMPHYYLYVINNVGEALIAKRRSYATTLSHLTAPLMSAGLYVQYADLHKKLQDYKAADNAMLKAEYAASLIADAKKEKLHEEIKFSDEFMKGNLTDADVELLHNHIHDIESAKVGRGLYVIGRPYSPEEIEETARLMVVDSIAGKWFAEDVEKGIVRAEQRESTIFFEQYLPRAHQLVAAVLRGEQEAPDSEAIATALRARIDLAASTPAELKAILNALNGGFTPPSPGGDPVANPLAVPTGRNLYGIDPERMPTRESYAVGRKLAEALIAEKIKTSGEYPKKVAFSLWGGEFVRTQGTNIGEIFFLLGVEPVWDSRGRVQDVRLIPNEKLKRPRIDVVVQTSGQFRGAATSRIRLIDKAIRLAAEAPKCEFVNYVEEGSNAAVKSLIAGGMAPEQARGLANARIFGGLNGGFGPAIMGLAEAGDQWENRAEVAETYINNMNALYTEEHWGQSFQGAFKAALQNTDTVVQSRSSNVWGPLSLDHVYEFMGGINLAASHVTGKDPEAYFNDLRTPGRARVQEAGQAAMVEARSTVLNPKYIKEMMEEGPGGAGVFAEVMRNSFGWETMKPDMLKDHLWEEYKAVLVDDRHNLEMKQYFEQKNPYALQEITGVMLETIRKEIWNADATTVKQLADLHVELVGKHGAGCSGFICGNGKLHDFIAQNAAPGDSRTKYEQAISGALNRSSASQQELEKVEGMTLKKQEPPEPEKLTKLLENKVAISLISGIILISMGAVLWGNYRRRKGEHRSGLDD